MTIQQFYPPEDYVIFKTKCEENAHIFDLTKYGEKLQLPYRGDKIFFPCFYHHNKYTTTLFPEMLNEELVGERIGELIELSKKYEQYEDRDKIMVDDEYYLSTEAIVDYYKDNERLIYGFALFDYEDEAYVFKEFIVNVEILGKLSPRFYSFLNMEGKLKATYTCLAVCYPEALSKLKKYSDKNGFVFEDFRLLNIYCADYENNRYEMKESVFQRYLPTYPDLVLINKEKLVSAEKLRSPD